MRGDVWEIMGMEHDVTGKILAAGIWARWRGFGLLLAIWGV